MQVETKVEDDIGATRCCVVSAMDGAPDQVVAVGSNSQPPGGEGDLKLPYRVCTVVDLEQRGYITNGVVEWVWARLHSYCQIKKEPGRLLMQNKEAIKATCRTLQVSPEEVHYRGRVAPEAGQPGEASSFKDHTLETRAYLVALLWLLKNRTLNSHNKALALQLLLGMVSKGTAAAAEGGARVCGMIYKDSNAGLFSQELSFTAQGMTGQWCLLLQHSAGATTLWKRLTATTGTGRCITTSQENASLGDIWLFSCFVWCHQKLRIGGRMIWHSLVAMLLPQLIVTGARCLVEHAMELSKEGLKHLPILKTKLGNIRKVCDPVNRLLLLMKLKGKKQRRSDIADTHRELGGSTFSMMRYGNYCDCLLHMEALEHQFWQPKQLCVSWDPSTYGGKEVFIGIAYAPSWNKACYLLAQDMSPTLVSELHPDMYDLAAKRKVARLDGYRGWIAPCNPLG